MICLEVVFVQRFSQYSLQKAYIQCVTDSHFEQ